jgi:hypothetical protein
MAIKTFTTGEVLTASDTNTYLNNGGLVLITSGITVSSVGGTAATVANGTVTVGTSNTSVTVSGAFSSTWDNYKIIYDGGTASANVALSLQLGATVTGYHYSIVYNQYNASTPLGVAAANTTAFLNAGRASTVRNNLNIDLFAPNIASYTGARYNSTDYLATTGFTIMGGGMLNDTTSYTAFTISGATMTGGKIRVYGYRQV